MPDLDPFPGDVHWPPEWGGCTVRGRYADITGHPYGGKVRFTPSAKAFLAADSGRIVLPSHFEVELDHNGSFVTALPATDDPNITPTNFTYKVEEAIGQQQRKRVYSIAAPLNGDIDLVDVSPIPAANGTPIYRGPRGEVGPQGPTGPAGPSGGAAAQYIHTQSLAATVWTITHDLGYDPVSVIVFDAFGVLIDGFGLQYLTPGVSLRLSFDITFSGTARLS